MVDLLKAFGRGILYVILCPFFLVVLALFAVIGLLAFIFQLLKSIIFFFTGQKFFPELPEDKELRLKREAEEAARNPQPQPQAQPQVERPQNNMVFEEMLDENNFVEEPAPIITPISSPAPQSVEQACFQEEIKPEPAPAPIPEPTPAPAPSMPEPEAEPAKEELISDKEADDAPLADFLDPFNDEPVMRDESNEILEVYKPKGNNDYTDADEYEDDTDSGVDIRFDD